MNALHTNAHPEFIMPNIEIPDGFIDTSYSNDEYPSWAYDDEALNISGYSTIQFWIAYDHGYDNGTWEQVLENGIYQVIFQPIETRDQNYLDYNENATWFCTNDWDKALNFILESWKNYCQFGAQGE